MQESNDTIQIALGDAILTIPAVSLVTAWIAQTLAPAAPVAAALTPPRIGTEWPGEGGIYAGIIRGAAGRPDYHLIVPTADDAAVEEVKFGRDTDVPSATSDYDGRANTIALVNAGGFPAAEWAHSLAIGPHSDFYLPARHELRLMWLNVPELFEKAWHWSSTQYAAYPYDAWGQDFDDGGQGNFHKSYAGRARAVRRLTIQ